MAFCSELTDESVQLVFRFRSFFGILVGMPDLVTRRQT
jgi:hypothetical protein